MHLPACPVSGVSSLRSLCRGSAHASGTIRRDLLPSRLDGAGGPTGSAARPTSHHENGPAPRRNSANGRRGPTGSGVFERLLLFFGRPPPRRPSGCRLQAPLGPQFITNTRPTRWEKGGPTGHPPAHWETKLSSAGSGRRKLAHKRALKGSKDGAVLGPPGLCSNRFRRAQKTRAMSEQVPALG